MCFSIRFFCFVGISQLKGKVVVGNGSLYYDFVYQYTVIFREKKNRKETTNIVFEFCLQSSDWKKKVDWGSCSIPFFTVLKYFRALSVLNFTQLNGTRSTESYITSIFSVAYSMIPRKAFIISPCNDAHVLTITVN